MHAKASIVVTLGLLYQKRHLSQVLAINLVRLKSVVTLISNAYFFSCESWPFVRHGTIICTEFQQSRRRRIAQCRFKNGIFECDDFMLFCKGVILLLSPGPSPIKSLVSPRSPCRCRRGLFITSKR